ncbi:STARD3 N-terminal like, isoform CRA_b [Mus musculus]|nr:STARD3 N-terminal like, isoform CRA_b [Mus musculus]
METPSVLLQDEPSSRTHGEHSDGEPELTRFSARHPFHQPCAAHGQD